MKRVLDTLKRIDAVVFSGAGKDIRKPKTGLSSIASLLQWLDYLFLSFFDRIDTKVFFKGRSVRTAKGRVRSRGEKRIAKFFDSHGIRYVYERPLTADGVKLHPDFYLPDYKVYVEFWGMAGFSMKYQKIMRLKKALYRKNSIPVISLYPKDVSNLERAFVNAFQKTMGRSLDLKGG